MQKPHSSLSASKNHPVRLCVHVLQTTCKFINMLAGEIDGYSPQLHV